MQAWLVINPNTTDAVTQALLGHLRAAGPGLAPAPWQAITAGFGAPYIADESSFAIAGHAVLDAWERAQAQAPSGGFGGVLVGCFGDPGIDALRECTELPVWGLAEASLHALWAQGARRVAIVTGGRKWQHMLLRWARAQGYVQPRADTGCCIHAVHVLDASGGQMMQSPEAAAQALAHSCREALRDAQTDAVLIGGAGLAGMGARVRHLTGSAAVWDCVELVRMHWAQHQRGALAV